MANTTVIWEHSIWVFGCKCWKAVVHRIVLSTEGGTGGRRRGDWKHETRVKECVDVKSDWFVDYADKGRMDWMPHSDIGAQVLYAIIGPMEF